MQAAPSSGSDARELVQAPVINKGVCTQQVSAGLRNRSKALP